MGRTLHIDEAWTKAREGCEVLLGRADLDKIVIIDDLLGRVHVIAWASPSADLSEIQDTIVTRLQEECSPFWGGARLVDANMVPEERRIWDVAWNDGVPLGDRLRQNDRHRNRTAWFLPIEKRQPRPPDGPPVVVFHSFKGGVGRTTALAAYAITRARRGERVAVVDVDLDAPGLGRLLDSDGLGTTARWGVVDYLLEATEDLPLSDYMHVCAKEAVTGEGRVEVFPAGTLDDAYLNKLSRLDFDVAADPTRHPLFRLLDRIRTERSPSVILLDGRAGLSPAAGLLLGGLAHLHVLFATTNPQSLMGLERVVRHLGYEQAARGRPQADCLVVQAMVPDSTEIGGASSAHFAGKVENIFRDGYYATSAGEEDEVWSLDDLGSRVAPHVPVALSYRQRFAFFETIDEIADALVRDDGYVKFVERLDARLAPAAPGGE